MNCGQTCIAMITGKSIREVEKLYGTSGVTYVQRHVHMLTQMGIIPSGTNFKHVSAGWFVVEVFMGYVYHS